MWAFLVYQDRKEIRVIENSKKYCQKTIITKYITGEEGELGPVGYEGPIGARGIPGDEIGVC